MKLQIDFMKLGLFIQLNSNRNFYKKFYSANYQKKYHIKLIIFYWQMDQVENARCSLLTKIKFLDDSIVTLNTNFNGSSEEIKMDNLILLTDLNLEKIKVLGENFAYYVEAK